jgi:hypothetical protein
VDTSILVFFVVMPFVVVTLWAFVSYFELKIAKDAWRTFAVRMKLNYGPALRLEGTYRGHHLVISAGHRVRLWRRGWRRTAVTVDQTHFQMAVKNPSKIWLVISNDDDVTRLSQLTGLSRLNIFQDVISSRRTTRGEPNDFLGHVLNVPSIEAKIDAMANGFTLWLTNDQLCLEHEDYVLDVDYLTSLLDLMSHIVRLVETYAVEVTLESTAVVSQTR